MKNILFKILHGFLISIGVIILTIVALLIVLAVIIIIKNIPPIKFNDWLIAGAIVIIWILIIFGLSKIPTMISYAYNKLKNKTN